MKRLLGLVLVVLAIAGLMSCGGPEAGLPSVPTSVSFISVPASMKNTSVNMKYVIDTNVTGWAYNIMRDFVTMGVSATEAIDYYLSNINYYSNFFANNIGKTAVLDESSGRWVFYNTNATYGYFYYGLKSSVTNVYCDWTTVEGNIKGQAEFFAENDTTAFEKGYIAFDNTVAVPYQDIILKPRTGYSQYETLRVRLEKLASGYTLVVAKGDLTNKATNNVNEYSKLKTWNLVGAGKESVDGGVYAWALTFVTNIVNPAWNSGSPFDTNVTYNYNEYFTVNKEIIWKTGVYILDGIPDGSGKVYYTNTNDVYTTNTKPTDADNAMVGETNRRLDSAIYPSSVNYLPMN